jgi:hypothetical protein
MEHQKLWIRWRRIRSLVFSRRGEYIGGATMSGGGTGGLTTWWHGLGVGLATL